MFRKFNYLCCCYIYFRCVDIESTRSFLENIDSGYDIINIVQWFENSNNKKGEIIMQPNISFQKNDLKKLLNVKKVVRKKATLPILTCFWLKSVKDNLRIAGTDLEKVEDMLVPTNDTIDIDVCVPAEAFYDMITELDEPVRLSQDSKLHKLFIEYSNGKYTLNGIDSQEFPPVDKIEKENI